MKRGVWEVFTVVCQRLDGIPALPVLAIENTSDGTQRILRLFREGIFARSIFFSNLVDV